MSGPAYFTRSRARIISLYEMPNHILFKILYKMPGEELVRMRKTCRFVNRKVEENKGLFSKNLEVGLDLAVEVRTRVEDFRKTDVLFGSESNEQLFQIVSLDSPFEHHFSGVPIRTLAVRGEHSDEGVIAIILERLKLRCSYFCICLAAPLQYLVNLADLVDSDNTDFSSCFLEREDESLFPIFHSGRRRSTYGFSLPIPPHILEEPEILTDFKAVFVTNSKVTKQQLCSFMKALTNLRSTGTLEEMSIDFPKRNPFTEKKLNFPPAKVLWKKAGLPQHPLSEERKDYICKMDLLDGKCAIIVKHSDCKEAGIKFIKNTPEDVLKVLVKELDIEEFEWLHKNIYMEAAEDEQIKMLRNYYKKKYMENA